MGAVTTRLRTLFEEVVRGRNPKYAHWNVAVPQSVAEAR
jgi:hypothetical protein